MPYIGTQPLTGQFKKLDSISVVNGQAAYTLNYNSAAYKPATANALLVSVNGVIQAAGDAYTISGSTITFTENLVTGDVIDFIIALGDTGSAVTPVDGSVTTAKIATDAVTSDKLAHDLTVQTSLSVPTIKDSSGSNTAITIDSSGRVFKPQVPFYYLRGGSAANKDVGSNEKFGSTNDGQAAFNTTGGYAGIRGFTYDSATGEINVPIDGLYHIGGNFYKNEDSAGVIQLNVNGGSVAFCRAGQTQDSANFSLTLQLSTNDKITYINASGADRIFYEGAQHTNVFGHLVG